MTLRYLMLSFLALAACARNPMRSTPDAGSDASPPDSAADTSTLEAGMDTGVADTGIADTGAADTGAADTGVADTGVADTGAADTGAADSATPDTGVADGGADTGMADAGPPPTPARGTYRYTRLPIGALRESHRVAFHPDGSYAVYLENSNVLHVYDWATRSDTILNIDPPGSATVTLSDFDFDPSGAFGLLVGTERNGSSDTGVVYRFDDAAWRAGTPSSVMLRQISADRAGTRFVAAAYPWVDGLPMVLAQTGSSPYVATLRRFDPTTGDFTSFITARATSAGCEDLAFVNNEFGGEGVALVCGLNGAEAPYWTSVGGVAEWRAGPSAGSLGNTSRVEAHAGGDYALAIGGSGRRIHRFQAGAWTPLAGTLWFRTLGILALGFQQDGRRALVVGRAAGSPLSAAVLEYRHDLYVMSEVADVSIAGFDAAPWLGDSNTFLRDVDFRPGCDGGLIVGGKSNFSGSQGLLIEFALEGGVSCGGVL